MHIHALEDDIRFEESHGYERPTKYYPPCAKCGEEVLTYSYKRGWKYVCSKCKISMREEKLKKESENDSAKERKYQKAVKIITEAVEGTDRNFDFAFKRIYEHLFRPGWFQSTEEIIVAMEMVYYKANARHQVKFGRYCADFVLPKDKIVLEVDGKLYHNRETRDYELVRDMLILQSLGEGWEVIRISDDYINTHPTYVLSAARKARKELQWIRKMNHGTLPKYHMYKRYIDKPKKDPYLNF